MLRIALTTLALLVLAVPALADDKDTAKKLVGKWVREVGDAKVTFEIKADKMITTLHTPNGDLVVQSAYEVSKDELKCKLTKIEKNEIGAGVEEDHKFSFKFKLEDGTLTISELKGNDGNEAGGEAKNLVEGEYKKEKEKNKEEKKDKK